MKVALTPADVLLFFLFRMSNRQSPTLSRELKRPVKVYRSKNKQFGVGLAADE